MKRIVFFLFLFVVSFVALHFYFLFPTLKLFVSYSAFFGLLLLLLLHAICNRMAHMAKSVLHDYETLEACLVLYIVTVFKGDQIFNPFRSVFISRCFLLFSKCNCFVFFVAFSNITRLTHPLVHPNEAFEIKNSHQHFVIQFHLNQFLLLAEERMVGKATITMMINFTSFPTVWLSRPRVTRYHKIHSTILRSILK